MYLFFVPNITGSDLTAQLTAEESHHAIVTLRMKVGDTIHLMNGRGDMFEATLSDSSKRGAMVEIKSHTHSEPMSYELHVAVAPTKNIDRYEWFLEKATEIGIHRITPIICEHSERKVVKHDRSEKIIMSATKQSLKSYLPQLDESMSIIDFLGQDFGSDTTKFIGYCADEFEKHALKDMLQTTKSRKIVVLIGPEGDFSAREVELAIKQGFQPITLGSSRLRTETAALVATTTANIMLDNL